MFKKLRNDTATANAGALESRAPEAQSKKTSDGWYLLLASFLSLYVELMLIRWIPSTVHVVAFFNNLVLIASVLGLGIGMAKGDDVGRAAGRALFRLAVVVLLLTVVNLVNPSVVFPEDGDYGINEVLVNLVIKIPMPALMVAIFALAAWAMIPIGQLVAAYFDRLERIPAYSVNIVGSLLGVLAFSLVALLELPPVVWFVVGLGALWLISPRWGQALVGLAVVGVIGAHHLYETRGLKSHVAWSPYYKVIAEPVFPAPSTLDDGFLVHVNDQFLLSGFNLRDDAPVPAEADPQLVRDIGMLRSYYNFPFTLRPAKRVLIMGSGAGNDVAAALRNGAEHVTAVEIDPLVLRLGRRHHPERPYASPKVEVVNTDARAYLNRTHEKFDLIIYATLDSHGLLSSVGNVRMDGFIYTRESVAAARNHLAPGGLMVLSFGPFREEVQYRQYATVRSVFGRTPLFYQHANDHRTIVAGAVEGVHMAALSPEWRRIDDGEVAAKLRQYPHATTPATDDWPHIYLRQRSVPREYLGVLGGIIALSVLMVGLNLRGAFVLDGHFFFLGAGFLLLETKSVTEFALLVGSTWQVNSAVFVVILLMILLANLAILATGKRISLPICFALIAISLLVEYAWPIGRWATGAGPLIYGLAAVYLGVPIVLAALIFATTFGRARIGSAALASNLLGTVLGGAAEYLSLAYGIRSLSLLALTMYFGAYVFWALKKERSTLQAARPSAATAPAEQAAVSVESR